MKLNDVFSLVLSLPDVRQAELVETPEFRVAGKIFATLPTDGNLVLKLTLEQQSSVILSDPKIFSPLEGTWGGRGWTNAEVEALNEAAALSAMILAWSNVANASSRD